MLIPNGFIIFIIFNVTISYTYAYHLNNNTLKRLRRQSSCGSNEFQCNDGQCINTYNRCDGKADCNDASDEDNRCALVLRECPLDTFRCTYGACVDGDARCNGQQECHDNSDELGCSTPKPNQGKCGEKFPCDDGNCIDQYLLCDGQKHCADGSDENVRACGNLQCPNTFFRCNYGACVDSDARCNDVQECADGSDEKDCPGSKPTTPPTGTTQGGCALPAIFKFGKYNVMGHYVSGQPIVSGTLVTIQCNANYEPYPVSFVACLDNKWSPEFPRCAPTCRPRISDSVDFTCELNRITKDCTKPMVEGTIARMKCKHFYQSQSSGNPVSRCEGGSWDIPIIKCTPECGHVIPSGQTLVINGTSATKGEFPWHVGIFRKKTQDTRFNNICGGSIINRKLVLTAAHCFTMDEGGVFINASYSIGAGKYYSAYGSPEDKYAQYITAQEILIRKEYLGQNTNYQDDIALVIVEKPFQITHVVQPVCIDWSNSFESQQLQENKIGTVVGWGFTEETGKPANELKQLNVPFRMRSTCLAVVPPTFQRFVTPDKFCAGFTNGSSVCSGDSGGGLVFYWPEDRKYYIRGLVSIGPLKEAFCDQFNYAAYTRITSELLQWISDTESQNRAFD